MRRLLWAGVLVACKAFALDVEQLPVWNPDSLFRDSVPVAVDSARPVQSLESYRGSLQTEVKPPKARLL